METKPARPLRVLLADDDEDDHIFFREALDQLNVQTLLQTVHDGDELIRLLNRNSDQLPHYIFLDLNMPRKNGTECLKEIRLLPDLNHTPVIIFSTSCNNRDVEDAFLHGANLFIQKPSGFGLMVRILDNVLRLDRNELLQHADRSRFLLS